MRSCLPFALAFALAAAPGLAASAATPVTDAPKLEVPKPATPPPAPPGQTQGQSDAIVPGHPSLASILAGLAAHHAVYKMTLDTTHETNVIGAAGTMTYEVLDACDGWAVQQRLAMTVTNRDGQDIQMLSDYTTWEAKDGHSLRFQMRQTTDTAVTQQTSGHATLAADGSGGMAYYDEPKTMEIKLPPGTVFPMAHTARLIQAALEGRKFLALPLFDGTTDTGADDTFITIPGWQKPAPSRFPALSDLPSGVVHISFFERAGHHQEPDYQVAQRYWSNGVADDLVMDFGDFAMDAKITDFKLEPHPCG